MGRHIGLPMITTSVKISPEFHKLCIEHRISFSEAMRIGISLILAERGLTEYDNNLNLHRKMRLYQQMSEEANNKLNELQLKNG